MNNHVKQYVEKLLVKAALLMGLLMVVVSCGKKNRFEIDVDKEAQKVKLERFDQDFDALRNSHDVDKDARALREKYSSEYMDAYTQRVIGIGEVDSVLFGDQVQSLLADSMYRSIYDEVQHVYDKAQVEAINSDLTTAWTYLHHYFPELKLPRVYGVISGFNQSIAVTETAVSVSLDCYLGADYAPYSQIGYDYQVKKWTPENVSMDVVYGYMSTVFEGGNKENLLQNIVESGKMLYLLSVVMPGKTEQALLGFDEEQYAWCQRNESAMWNYLMENRLLYNTSHLVISKFVNPAPFTVDFPHESPGQAVLWLGMRIVREYMENNEDVTLPALMKEHDAQKILERSKYKPEK